MDEEAKRLLAIIEKAGAFKGSKALYSAKLAYISARIMPFLKANGVDTKSIQSMDDLDNKGDLNAATIEADFKQVYNISNTTNTTITEVCGALPQKFKQLSGQGKPPSRPLTWADKQGLPLEEVTIIPKRGAKEEQPVLPPNKPMMPPPPITAKTPGAAPQKLPQPTNPIVIPGDNGKTPRMQPMQIPKPREIQQPPEKMVPIKPIEKRKKIEVKPNNMKTPPPIPPRPNSRPKQ